MGEVLLAQSSRGAKYMPLSRSYGCKKLWITLVSWNSGREAATPRCGAPPILLPHVLHGEFVVEDLRGDSRAHCGCIGGYRTNNFAFADHFSCRESCDFWWQYEINFKLNLRLNYLLRTEKHS